jgi:acyl-CoA synthetase (AMP-forming)/AMP-acid ligase II
VVEIPSGRSLTHAGLVAAVAGRTDQLAACLRSDGRGRVVAVEHGTPEGVDLLVDVLACAAAGAVALVRNAAHPDAVWQQQCVAAGPAAVLRPGRAPAAPAAPAAAHQGHLHPDAFQLVATSGSTGAPKLVQLTQHGTLGAAAVYGARVPLAPGETVAVPQSLATVGALPSGVLPALLTGGTAVLGHGWGVRTFVRALADHDAAFAMAVTGWWQACLAATWPPLPRLRVLGVGGAPWQHLVREIHRRLPRAEILGNYGLTETHGPALQVSTGERADVDGVAGRPVPGIEAEIRDGELWLRGPLVTPGYLDGRHHLDADGWLRTGDVAEAVEGGWIRVIDRADDLVNVGGRKVYPAEVEVVIRRVPGVVDCAVVRTDGTVDRRRLAAFVQAGPDGPLAPDVRRAVREGVGSHAVPTVVELVDSLPRTGSGKVDREALRRQVSASGAT